MLLFVHNPLANKPPIPVFSTSGAINEAEFLTFDLTPRLLGESWAVNEAVATSDLLAAFDHDMSPMFLGMSLVPALNEAVAPATVLADFPHDLSPRFIGVAWACGEAVAVSNDCSGLYQ